MSFEKTGETLPGIVAGADLTAAQFRFLDLNGSAKAVLAGAGASIVGVLQNKPNTDEPASIWGPGSVAKVEAGAAVALGADVTPNATGQAVTSASGNYIAGKSLTPAAATGEIISVWITQPGRTA